MEGRSLGLAPVGVVVGPRPGPLQSKIFLAPGAPRVCRAGLRWWGLWSGPERYR